MFFCSKKVFDQLWQGNQIRKNNQKKTILPSILFCQFPGIKAYLNLLSFAKKQGKPRLMGYFVLYDFTNEPEKDCKRIRSNKSAQSSFVLQIRNAKRVGYSCSFVSVLKRYKDVITTLYRRPITSWNHLQLNVSLLNNCYSTNFNMHCPTKYYHLKRIEVCGITVV